MAYKPLTRLAIWVFGILASWGIVLAALWLFSSFNAQAAIQITEPPSRFDYEPRTAYSVTEVTDHMELVRRCRMGFHAHLVGCALPRTNEIYIIAGLSDEDFATVLRHEKAHLNGWRH